MRNLFVKVAYVIFLVFSLLSLFIFLYFLKVSKRIREINLGDNHIWEEGGHYIVTNHPSWIDQFLIVALRIPHWGTTLFPYVVVAEDSVNKIFFLKILKKLTFVLSINRKGQHSRLLSNIRKIKTLLADDYNIIIAGPAGRDFRGSEDEIIFSPKRRKLFRMFTKLPGFIATTPGVKIVVCCIEGTDKLYKEFRENGEIKSKFSYYNFIVKFLLLGKIKIIITYSEGMILSNLNKDQANEVIQKTALALLDR